MYIEQIYTSCLAQASYYIESNKEAIIIDPIRDFSPYIELLKKRKTKLKYIFETHFHADFVSGHIELAKLTNAKIAYSRSKEFNEFTGDEVWVLIGIIYFITLLFIINIFHVLN